jgi:type IV pilus assembly protein PilC
MTTTPGELQTRGTGLAVVGTMIPAALVLGLFVLLVTAVPGAKRRFDEFNLALPWLTLAVIRVSNWVAGNWWLLVPPLAALGVGNFVLLRELGRRNTALPVIWMTVVTLVVIALIVVTLLSVEIPMMRLREGLAK